MNKRKLNILSGLVALKGLDEWTTWFDQSNVIDNQLDPLGQMVQTGWISLVI